MNELNRQPEDQNTVFQVLNSDSAEDRRYSLNVPYQVTYEFISGTTSSDYLNAITLSEQGSYFYREQADEHNEKALRIPPHSHDYYEIMIILEGSVSHTIEDNVYTYGAGSVCFLNRNLHHRERFSEKSRLLFLGFSVPYLSDLFARTKQSGFPGELSFFDTKLARFIRHDMQHSGEKAYLDFMPTMKHTQPYKTIHDLSELLINTLMQPSFGTSFLVDGLLASILAHIADAKNYHCTTVELKTSGDYLLYMRISHLLEESHGMMTRNDLSLALNYSGDYISRVVKKYSGLSLHEYSLKFALRRASYLLTHTKEPITSIVNDLGFSNRTYFYKIFQQQYGMTPKEYRNQQ